MSAGGWLTGGLVFGGLALLGYRYLLSPSAADHRTQAVVVYRNVIQRPNDKVTSPQASQPAPQFKATPPELVPPRWNPTVPASVPIGAGAQAGAAIAGGVVSAVGEDVSSRSVGASPFRVSNATDPQGLYAARVAADQGSSGDLGGALGTAGVGIAGAGPALGGIGTAGQGLVNAVAGSGKRTPQQERLAYGGAAVAGVQGTLNLVPFVGPALSQLVGVGAQTYEGQHAEASVGGYYQKLFRGDLPGAFSFGGAGHSERQAKLFSDVDAGVARLKKGGMLTQADVTGLTVSVNQGYRYVGGYDLARIPLKVGTNPFLAAPDPTPQRLSSGLVIGVTPENVTYAPGVAQKVG